MYAVFKRELFSLLNSLMAYITIGVFLLAAGLLLWFFPDTSILDYGYAELTSFFSLAPFLFMFLIPAISMRSFAEERREGTYILLATRPLTDWQIILAKYFACTVLVLFSLVPTLIYYYTIKKLAMPGSDVDSGAMIGSYIGLLFLGTAFTSIGVFASSITKNQVIAFAISVFLCFMVYSGFDAMAKMELLASLQNMFVFLSVNEHYQSVSRGVVYFLSIVLFFLLLTRYAIGGRKW
jgi:ABC-2 type transport system permease protein